jgi:hypothetical protein
LIEHKEKTMNKRPLPDYADYDYERRPPPGSFRDWLQKHSVQRIGMWLILLGILPVGIVYIAIVDTPDQAGVRYYDYLLTFWLFACWACASTLYALKGIHPGIVTIYGPGAKATSGLVALASWGIALLSLYLALRLLLGGG